MNTAFDMFDADADGYITEAELGIVLRLQGFAPTEAEVKELVNDPNYCEDPGKLSLAEVKAMVGQLPRPPSSAKQDLMDAFCTFDTDQNGLIPESDIRNVLTFIGEAIETSEVDNLLNKCKVDQNGKVKYSELVDYLMNGW